VAAPGEPVYLVTGSDRPKIDRTLERLRAHFDPGAVERLTAAGPEGASGVRTCDAPWEASTALLQRFAVLGQVETFDLMLFAHP